jgi:hypothetical protein
MKSAPAMNGERVGVGVNVRKIEPLRRPLFPQGSALWNNKTIFFHTFSEKVCKNSAKQKPALSYE